MRINLNKPKTETDKRKTENAPLLKGAFCVISFDPFPFSVQELRQWHSVY